MAGTGVADSASTVESKSTLGAQTLASGQSGELELPDNEGGENPMEALSEMLPSTEKFDSELALPQQSSIGHTAAQTTPDHFDAGASTKLSTMRSQYSGGVLEKIDRSGYTLADILAVSSDIFTRNGNSELVLKPVVLSDAVSVEPDSMIPQDVLDRVRARIMLNDRANAYLELYQATGEPQLLLQAQITTYAGAIGSMALVGNMFAKYAAGEKYNISLDQFSLDILDGAFKAVEKATHEGKTVGELDRNFFQEADFQVWYDKGMGHLFPGNIQFVDAEQHSNPELAKILANSPGAVTSLNMGKEFVSLNSYIEGLGTRPADFAGKPEYEIIGGEDDRFISVINKSTGSLEVFWDNDIETSVEEWPFQQQFPTWNKMPESLRNPVGIFDIPQIDNVPRADNEEDLARGNAIREYLQAGNRHIPAFVSGADGDNKYLKEIREEVEDGLR